jgi:hypothetical protein
MMIKRNLLKKHGGRDSRENVLHGGIMLAF